MVYNPKNLNTTSFVFSAPSPKRAVEKAIVRTKAIGMREYVVRRSDRNWGVKYIGRHVSLKRPIVIKRGGVTIKIRNATRDVSKVPSYKYYF